MSSYTREQLEDWVKSIKIPSVSKVLDIGGSQNPIKHRIAEKGEASEYRVLDIEQPHECKQKPDIVMDINYPYDMFWDEDDKSSWKEEGLQLERYDYVFCLEVSEYLWNPYQALRNINWFLKHGGILYMSFHFIYPQHNPVKDDCLRYTPAGVDKLLIESGFKVLEHKHRIANNYSNLMNLFAVEKMKFSRDTNLHNVVGSLITAQKI